MSETQFAKGLAGVIAAASTICYIDGEKGVLSYRGYDIRDLTENATFSEVTYLLLHGKVPTAAENQALKAKLVEHRAVDASVINVLRALPLDTHPMIALQTAVAAHGSQNPLAAEHSVENFDRALQLIARVPTMVAAWARIKNGDAPIDPRSDLGHGQNFLYMVNGEAPDEETGDIFEDCLILHMEHSFNASTFTARVVASTMAPLDASVSAAVGALYGPLHGGANERVLQQLDEVESADAAEAWVIDALANKRKIMGMGHRVYRAKDPRAFVLQQHLETVAAKQGGSPNYAKLKVIETVMAREMEAKGKPIYPNVDYFSGSLYEMLGIGTEHFTPIFAIARVVGWCSHVLEQWEDNRIFRPRALYEGEKDQTWGK